MKLEAIIIGAEAKKPLHMVQQAKAVKAKGLEGDRYFYHQGTFNQPLLSQTGRDITLIDYAALSLCNQRTDSHLDFTDLRRNLVISDLQTLAWPALKKKRFYIGDAAFEIVRTAPPCRYLSRLLDTDMMTALKHIGGYRAKVLQSGTIHVGDTLHFC